MPSNAHPTHDDADLGDASALHKEIDALRASEERYRFFVESIPQLVWSSNSDGSSTDFSQRCLDFIGMSAEEAQGKGWMKAIHPDDVPEMERRWSIAVASESDYTMEYRIRRASDGAYRWAKATAHPMRDPSGRVVSWIGATTEIEDERRAADELRRSHSHLTAILSSAPIAFFATDASGYITLMKGRGLRALGLDPAVCLGLHASVLCQDDDVHAECVAAALKGEQRQQYHERNGFWLDLIYSPLEDEDGKVVGITCVATDFTTIRRASDEVKRSHAHLQMVLSSSPMVFWAADLGGILTVLKGQGLKQLGIDPSDFIGKPASLLDPTSRGHQRCIEDALSGKRAQQRCEKSGYWMDCRYEPVLDVNGEVAGVACVSTDVTSEHVKDLEIEASEARYRTLTEALPLFVWILEPTGICTFVNKAFHEFTGYNVDDYNSLGLKAYLHPEDLPMVLKRRSQALAEGEYCSVENRYRRKDGEYRWYLSGINPVKDETGAILRWIGIAFDIHERKLADEALGESEERLRFYLEATRDGIFDVDLTTGERTWSDRNYELLGLKPGSVKPSLDAVVAQTHPDDRDLVRTGVQGFIAVSDHNRFDFRIKDADGQYKWRLCECKVFRDDAGVAIRMVGAITDIHEQKVAEERIRELNEQLEERVYERTKELEATTAELQEFCYSVSHDLRGPLRSINGFSQALLEDFGHELDGAGHDHLNRIRNASVKLSDLIDALLSMSRITRADMERREVDITAVCHSVVEELRTLEPGRNVRVTVAPNMSTFGDSALIQTALTNLVENAWKFTSKEPHAHIEVGMSGSETFFVKDNGVGFDMAYANKLFAPFQRLHSSEEFPGTGVGLAIVSRVIQRHGGSISAEAAVNGGATFTFTLPSRSSDRKAK